VSPPALKHKTGIVAQALHSVPTTSDYDGLIELAGAAQFVLITEASHGTNDSYAPCAELTRQVIAKNDPLERNSDWERSELSETYAEGL
jgi:erythromycin esterase-like protein